MTDAEIAWAAGLFEGEGAICGTQKYRSIINENGERRKSGFRWELIMHSTDHDVLRRFADVVGMGDFYGPYRDKRGDHYKPQLRWYIGSLDGCQHVLRMLLPWLGERRRAKALECLGATITRPWMTKGYRAALGQQPNSPPSKAPE